MVCGGALGGSAKVGFLDPRKWGYISDPEKVVLLGWGGKVGFWGIAEKWILGPPRKVTVLNVLWGNVSE